MLINWSSGHSLELIILWTKN